MAVMHSIPWRYIFGPGTGLATTTPKQYKNKESFEKKSALLRNDMCDWLLQDKMAAFHAEMADYWDKGNSSCSSHAMKRKKAWPTKIVGYIWTGVCK